MSGRRAEGAMRLIQAKVGTKAAQICPAPRPVVTGAVPVAATSGCSDPRIVHFGKVSSAFDGGEHRMVF